MMLLSCTQNQKNMPFQKRIMSYNTQHCSGLDDSVDVKRTADVIKTQNPDVVAIQELDSMVDRSFNTYQLGDLSEYTGYYPTYAASIPLKDGKYGIGVLTREEPKSVTRIPLPGEEPRVLLVVELEDYVFACTHLDLTEEARLESLPIIFDEAKKWDKPFVMAGDWNDEPGSKTMDEIGKEFTFISDTTKYTFDAANPTACIDYIAAFNNGHEVQTLKYEVLDEPVASDHRPIIADVSFLK